MAGLEGIANGNERADGGADDGANGAARETERADVPRSAILELLDEAGIRGQRKLIERLVETSLGLGQDGTSRANLKLSSAALSEMRRAFRLFAGHDGTPKVTIFGSARTLGGDPLWAQAEESARRLAEHGWMVVTGAGPGIMEAAARGAGPEQSLGISIRLPFEEKPNDMVNQDGNHVAMRYFFTRKLMLVKESSGFVCLPGGFGTLDETFELLTLQQTGKMLPAPIVLLDRPGGGFWRGFERFVREELTDYGMISAGDLDRVLITDSVAEAVAEIEGFWRNFDSLRWTPDRSATGHDSAPASPRAEGAGAEGAGAEAAQTEGVRAEGVGAGEGSVPPAGAAAAASAAAGPSPIEQAPAARQYDRLVLRLRRAPSDDEVAELNERFGGMLAEGRIEATEPLQPEIADRDRLELPRLTLVPNPRAIGELHRLIRAINGLGSAPRP